MSLPSALVFALRRALPTIVGLALVLAADAVLDGWPLLAIAVVTIVVLIVYYERAGMRADDGPLAAVPKLASSMGWWVPLAVAIAAYFASGDDARVMAVTAVAGSVVAVALLAWWYARAPPAAPT